MQCRGNHSACLAVVVNRREADMRDWSIRRCGRRTVFLSDYCAEHLAKRSKRVVLAE